MGFLMYMYLSCHKAGPFPADIGDKVCQAVAHAINR